MATSGQLGTDVKKRVGALRLNNKKQISAKNDSDMEDKVSKHLRMRAPSLLLPGQLNVTYFEAYTASMTTAATTRYIKQCQTILKLCFGVNARDLVAYSCGGERFDHETIAVAYRGVIHQIEQGKLTVRSAPMDIIDALMKDSPKYRSGTHSKEFLKLQATRKAKYREMIDKVKVCVHECECT